MRLQKRNHTNAWTQISGKLKAIVVHFPGHWMISWPFDSKTSRVPDCAKDLEKFARSGITCIAEDGSSSAFLVIYQDLAKVKIQ